MHKHDRIAQLIAEDTKPEEALRLVGMTLGYYERLKGTIEFQKTVAVLSYGETCVGVLEAAGDGVQRLSEGALVTQEEYDQVMERFGKEEREAAIKSEQAVKEDRWAVLESAALKNAISLVSISDLKDVNVTLGVLAKREGYRRDSGIRQGGMLLGEVPVQAVLVSLVLPAYQKQELMKLNEAAGGGQSNVVKTTRNEVISVDGRDLTSMDTTKIRALLEVNKPADEGLFTDLMNEL